MKTLTLIQGTPEWHTHRATARNASDAPAIMGMSPYKTRTALIAEKATGIQPEIDAATQKRFDKGHEVEPALRAYAERLIGDEVYPIIATTDDGYLSASFDGVNLNETILVECKQPNKDKLASIVDYGVLPDADYWQVVQQFAVCDTAEKCIYVCGDGTDDGTASLIVQRATVEADIPKLRAGWKQFDADLADYVPETVAPAVVAESQETLPAVSIQVSGALTVSANLGPFGDALRAYIEGINKKPETDQDFANLDAAVKNLKTVEERLTAAEDSAIAQTGDIDALRRQVADLRNLARDTRLAAEKIVKAEKENRRTQIIESSKQRLSAHLAELNADLGKPYIQGVAADFAGAVKGLKTLSSIQNAVDTCLASAKIEANQAHDRIAANLATYTEQASGYETLFPDLAVLVQKQPDDFAGAVKLRIAEHKEAEERRKQREAEEQRIAREAIAAAQQRTLDAEGDKAIAAAPNVTPLRPTSPDRQTDDDLRTEIGSYIAKMNRQQLNLVLMFCKDKAAA